MLPRCCLHLECSRDTVPQRTRRPKIQVGTDRARAIRATGHHMRQDLPAVISLRRRHRLLLILFYMLCSDNRECRMSLSAVQAVSDGLLCTTALQSLTLHQRAFAYAKCLAHACGKRPGVTKSLPCLSISAAPLDYLCTPAHMQFCVSLICVCAGVLLLPAGTVEAACTYDGLDFRLVKLQRAIVCQSAVPTSCLVAPSSLLYCCYYGV